VSKNKIKINKERKIMYRSVSFSIAIPSSPPLSLHLQFAILRRFSPSAIHSSPSRPYSFNLYNFSAPNFLFCGYWFEACCSE
jgi:hypothetical protein